VPILNKVFADMTPRQRRQISNTWLQTQYQQGIELEKILQWVLPIGISLLGITMFVLYSNRRLTGEIKERKRMEVELLKATRTAEQANQAKSDFLANMSHEIRTPMNAVLGMCHILKDSKLDDEQLQNLEVIQSSSDTLLMLINDILDLSKIEAGKLTLENAKYDLNEVLEQLRTQIILLINNRNVSFNIDVADDVPHTHSMVID
jgi:signal transduction histidine kinase